MALLKDESIPYKPTTYQPFVTPPNSNYVPVAPTQPMPPATSQELAGWAAAIQNRNQTTPAPPTQADTFTGFSSGQNPFQPTGQETQPYFDSQAPLPYTSPQGQGSTPPNVSNDAMNLFLGGGRGIQPSIPVNLGAGNTGWFDPQDPHPEVAFAKQHFDTAGWSMQDWIKNSMRFYDVNDKDYYFRPGSPYSTGQWNGGKQPFSSGGFGGGAPRGSSMGGQGVGGQSYPSGSPAMSGGAVGLPPVSAPMVSNVLPTNVPVASDLTQLEIPDELWALIPEQLRGRFGNSLMQWLRSMGYSGRGNIGRYGERSYQRPPQQTGNVWFTPEMFNAFADPETAKWAKWLLGERGFTARTAAPEGASPTPPQG